MITGAWSSLQVILRKNGIAAIRMDVSVPIMSFSSGNLKKKCNSRYQDGCKCPDYEQQHDDEEFYKVLRGSLLRLALACVSGGKSST